MSQFMIRLFSLVIFALWLISLKSVMASEILETRVREMIKNDRILIVAFSDLHINRIQRVSPSAGYRKRGNYQSSSWGKRVSSEIEEEYGITKLTEWPVSSIGLHCAVYWVPESSSFNAIKQALEADERIDLVQTMRYFKTRGHRYNDPYFQFQKNLHTLDIEWAHSYSTGKGVDIAVIDTGMDITHSDLSDRVILSQNFAQDFSEDFNSDLHGTAVSGIIAARANNNIGIIGVAPDAQIIALKACWHTDKNSFEASCNSFTLALAINKAIELESDILNFSLAGPEDPLLLKLLEKAHKKGIIIVAADPGPEEADNRFPASWENAIAVQNFDSSKEDFEHAVINVSGAHILTTLPFDTYEFVSGSSMSAAQVTGIVALLIAIQPDIKTENIKNTLIKYFQSDTIKDTKLGNHSLIQHIFHTYQ
jgi:hypothetical protein